MSRPDRPSARGYFQDDSEARREAFDELVARAVQGIPTPFAEHLDSVAFVVEDEPPPERVPPGSRLFGFYQGVPRTAWGAEGAPIPSQITIYRIPHELSFPDPARRAEAVESTVLHEVAHHFGIDDARLRVIESERARRRRGR